MADRNLAMSWKKFAQNFNNFAIATRIHDKDDTLRVATLLSVIGQGAVDTYNTFTWDEESDSHKYDKVFDKFASLCKGKKNTTYERYLFNSRSQQDGEPIDVFVTALKNLAETCEFGELKDSLICDRIILGIADHGIQKRLLRNADLTLDRTITIIRTTTTASTQLSHMAGNEQSRVYAVKSQSRQHPNTLETGIKSSAICFNCGGAYPHTGECPAYGETCSFCRKRNHFAKFCRSKKEQGQQQLQANAISNKPPYTAASDNDTSDEGYVF